MNPRPKSKQTYNERLFDSGGIRAFFHNSRFNWIRTQLKRYKVSRLKVFELGCFDGRLTKILPEPPLQYLGFDANWEGGLSSVSRDGQSDNIKLQFSDSVSDLAFIENKAFDITVALETLEHLPPDQVTAYLAELARITVDRLFVTVPNEKGIVFLGKFLAKKAFFGGTQDYRVSEVVNATLGRMHEVERDDHKGFDYENLIAQLSKDFAIEKVVAIPFCGLPPSLGFTIGIVGKVR